VIFAKLSKCDFWLKEIKFLGHTISEGGIVVDPDKVQEVMNWSHQQLFVRFGVFWDWPGIIDDSSQISLESLSP
jgi:hypothetical protein